MVLYEWAKPTSDGFLCFAGGLTVLTTVKGLTDAELSRRMRTPWKNRVLWAQEGCAEPDPLVEDPAVC